jgi:outer membrane protein
MRLARLAAAPLALAAAALFTARPAFAQQGTAAPKVAYINSQVILQAAPGRAEAEAQFEKEMAAYRQQVQRMGDSLQTMIADYSKAELSLSPAAKDTRQKAIRARQDQYQQRTQQLEEQAQQRQMQLIQPVTEKIQKAIADIRAEENYAMIFDAGSNAGVLVAADTSLNITDKVLARLGVSPAQIAAAKSAAGGAAPAPAGAAATTPATRPAGAPLTSPAGVSRPKPPTN